MKKFLTFVAIMAALEAFMMLSGVKYEMTVTVNGQTVHVALAPS